MTTVLLAHGSPDPRHARGLGRLRDRLADLGPVETVYLEHDRPQPSDVAPGLTGEVVVVPMLITPAFHAREDVPTAARQLAAGGASVRVTPPLGGDPAMLDAVTERVHEARPGQVDAPVLLLAGGSSSGAVSRGLTELLARCPREGWASTTLAAPDPRLAEGRIVVPYTLAEGVLHDRAAELAAAAGSPFVPGGLGETGAVRNLIARRVRT